jgi:hypothetical protein
MKPSIFAAFALVFTVAGYAKADNRSFAGAALFHDVVQMTCGFNMTPESAKKAQPRSECRTPQQIQCFWPSPRFAKK